MQILPLHVMEHVDKGPKDTPEFRRVPEPGREVEGTDSLIASLSTPINVSEMNINLPAILVLLLGVQGFDP